MNLVKRKLRVAALRKGIDAIAEKLGIQTQQDWYSISQRQVSELVGKPFLNENFNGSLVYALKTVYPEFTWNPIYFHYVPQNLWKDIKLRREMMDWIGQQLGVEKQSDWYHISTDSVFALGGESMLNRYYSSSLQFALSELYPEFEWNPILFHVVHLPHKSQHRVLNHRKKMDRIGEKLGIETQEDWYKVTGLQVMQHGGEYMLYAHYNSSLFHALQAVYPEFTWNPLLCVAPPRNTLQNVELHFIKQTLDEMHYQVDTQWKEVLSSRFTSDDRLFNKISKLLGGKRTALATLYPELHWNNDSGGEAYLEPMLKTLSKVEKQKKIGDFVVDFYLPKFSLALEFQGSQHYHHTYRSDLSLQQNRDERKRVQLGQLGITLVEIPYWWHGSFESLLHTIKKRNPLNFNLTHLNLTNQ